MSELKDKTAKGLLWGAMNNGAMQILNAVFGIVLGRLLSLSDYGLVGMLAIFTAVASALQESGFTSALVNKQDAADRDFNAVFWFSLLMGTGLYFVLFLCAPLIASYFHQPDIIVLSKVAFLAIPLSAIGIVPQAYMFKHLMVKETTVIRISALLISGLVGITMALLGKAYWSLVWQQLLYVSITSFGKFACIRWRPTRKMDFTPVRAMFGFSSKMMLTTIINTVSNNILTVIFGRLFSSSIVGCFTQAYKWNTMAYSLVAGTVAQVAQPVFARVTDDDSRLAQVFRKIVRFTAFLSFPVMFGLAIIAREFIVLTIGEKWIPSVPLLQILCVSGAFLPLHTAFQNLLVSKGRSDAYMWGNIGLILTSIGTILAFHSQGIEVMVAAYSALNIVWVSVWQILVHRLISVRYRDMARDVMPFFLTSGIVMLAVFYGAAFIKPMFLRMFVKILVAALAYFAVMKLAHAKILDESLQYLLHRKR